LLFLELEDRERKGGGGEREREREWERERERDCERIFVCSFIWESFLSLSKLLHFKAWCAKKLRGGGQKHKRGKDCIMNKLEKERKERTERRKHRRKNWRHKLLLNNEQID
jgi:hypothetical protein